MIGYVYCSTSRSELFREYLLVDDVVLDYQDMFWCHRLRNLILCWKAGTVPETRDGGRTDDLGLRFHVDVIGIYWFWVLGRSASSCSHVESEGTADTSF